ncbi:steroid 17-alpha-hydroxylase/17,20 lyase-like [Dendronephthya gigantea]|uniref:steroid 17-alpha-hydroxylase/17,20 lyase-like n=1 Tax=Dendronephthya gigantea TaxID=151771 RepID=UPI00106A56F8|nr:steroid 17-alpha-hydroxylase/17,20 lyase-like [Dendronephthya gigantea]
MFVEVSLSLSVCWLLWFLITTHLRRRSTPPGPFPLPIIGNAHQMGTNPPFSMERIHKKYGEIYALTLPVGTFVILNNGRVAREALVTRKDDFSGRPGDSANFPLRDIFDGKDISFTDFGASFLFRRRIISSAFHVFGEGLQEAEARVNKEVGYLLEWFGESEGKAVTPYTGINSTMINIMSEWLFSKRYDYHDPTMKELFTFNEKLLYVVQQGRFYQAFPLLKYLPTKVMKTLGEVLAMRDELFGSQLNEHTESYQDDVIRDITDALLAEYNKEKAKKLDKTMGSKDDIKYFLMNIFVAASDTSASVLTWFMLYMVVYKDVQEKIQKEIDDTVGDHRLPNWKDSENLPYLLATICEVMRHSNFVPINLPHKAIRDSTINGYHIPKETTILFNFATIHNDPRDWEEPRMFKPERFISEDGKFVGWNSLPSFFPFGAGRRMCPGENLGKLQVFVVTSNVLHQFCLKTVDNEPEPNLDNIPGPILYPKEYRVCAVKRY